VAGQSAKENVEACRDFRGIGGTGDRGESAGADVKEGEIDVARGGRDGDVSEKEGGTKKEGKEQEPDAC
jgi:hypothetical protein